MAVDKVLQRLELENRKVVLLECKSKIKEGIEIKTNRGSFVMKSKTIIGIISRQIESDIEDIDIELETLTGLNQDKMDKYYKMVEA